MKTPPRLLPDLPTLRKRLTEGLFSAWGNGRPLRILSRRVPPYMSTFPNEIVTCQLAGGAKRRVFIKYDAGQSHQAFGHRGTIAYEAEVYQRVLQTWARFRPKCLGAHTDARTREVALFLEYADRCAPLSEASWKQRTCLPGPMVQTARWLAHFHAHHEPRVGQPALAFLKAYDAAYYRSWAQRTFKFARPLQTRFPWLAELRTCGDAWFAPLLSAAPTVIHGEFFAKTVLVRNEILFALDWESTAIAAGEIDLVTLTDGEGWPATVVRQCEANYQRARWPNGAPVGFKRMLAAARIYQQFRWLGDRSEKTLREKTLWRFEHLRDAAKNLGLL
ncbi:MAG TPA: hypothetical protein VNU68_10005 [Verrucomicrobiae bacterium]|nr:hypothetical protein [Verrucomicrobiae bacterium]